MLNEENPNWGTFGPKSLKGSPVTIHLYVENVDDVFAQAVARVRKSLCRSTTCFGGTATARWKTLRSPMVDRHPCRDVSPAEMQKAMEQMGS